MKERDLDKFFEPETKHTQGFNFDKLEEECHIH